MDAKLKGEVRHHFKVELLECRGGRVLWTDEFDNSLLTGAANKYLDDCLVTGNGSPAWYLSLKLTGTVSASDTLASHSGWNESQAYSNATRPAWTPNGTPSSGSVSNSNSPAEFNINGSATIHGLMICNQSNKASNSGVLLGAADFSGGSQAVENGNILRVTLTMSLS